MTPQRDDGAERHARVHRSDANVRDFLGTLREAERSAAEARDRATVLQGMLSAYAAIVSAKNDDDIVATLLRTARSSLGFERAIWVEIEETRVAVMRKIVDACGSRVADETLEYDRWSSIATVVRGQNAWACGREGELGAPLVDVRNWYALVPVRTADIVVALVYVDGHAAETPNELEIELLVALAEITAAALQRNALVAQLHVLASRDPLTGLYNRRAFGELLAARIGRASPSRDSPAPPFVFAVIDVDDFKTVNDTRGHAVGDAVLKRLARTLQTCSRTGDVVGRYAGDEFVMVLDGATDVDADAMLSRLSAHVKAAGISCSIGGARYPFDATDAESLFAVADRSLYAAKAGGKNRYALVAEHHALPDF